MASKLLAAIGLVIGLVGIVLEWMVSMPALFEAGHRGVAASIHFFSYLTILSNLGVVLVYLGVLTALPGLSWTRHPVTRATVAGIIGLVMIFYHVLLARLGDFQGTALVATTLLHYVVPVLYIAWWFGCAPHGALGWRNLPIMLLPALIYFVYILVRGVIVAEYPYPTLNVIELGYPQVFVNALATLAGLAILCAAAIFIDRLFGRNVPAAS